MTPGQQRIRHWQRRNDVTRATSTCDGYGF